MCGCDGLPVRMARMNRCHIHVIGGTGRSCQVLVFRFLPRQTRRNGLLGSLWPTAKPPSVP
jgi:hypothetical protein